MALTVVIDQKLPTQIQGDALNIATGTITFDSSYPTGGEAVTPISKYFKDLYCVITDTGGGISTAYDRTNNLLLAYWSSNTTDGEALVEVTNTTDLSAVVVSFIAIGR